MNGVPLCPSRGHVGKVTVPRGRGPRSLEINRPPLEDPNRSLGKVPKSTRSFRLSKTAPCPLRSDKRDFPPKFRQIDSIDPNNKSLPSFNRFFVSSAKRREREPPLPFDDTVEKNLGVGLKRNPLL